MISVEDMRALEDKAVGKGISKITLMENAGREIAKALEKKAKGKRILIVCYHGNNGGDGFVVARHLADKAEVEVLFLGDESRFKEEAKHNFEKIQNNELIQFTSLDFVNFDDYDIIIDAILGMSYGGELKYPLGAVVDQINAKKKFVASIDVPTGLNADTGEVVDKIIDADMIITFHELKKGLKKYKDKTIVVDIGIPK
ncbi:NAD(P)H-hydrate epimerase [Candidatus Woesearchaeota archaeon]|nr:NAD(P)H-hydrate epimerase [Candidatus Woesearchaeota archaeon]